MGSVLCHSALCRVLHEMTLRSEVATPLPHKVAIRNDATDTWQHRHRKRLYQIIPAFATFALAMKPRYHSNGNIIACRWNVKWPESITTGSERRRQAQPAKKHPAALCQRRQQENSILSRFSLVFYGQSSESFVKPCNIEA